VRELVENRPDEPRLAPPEHCVEERIGQAPERRVGCNPAHGHVVALPRQTPRLRLCTGLVEVAAIRDAAGDRKTPAPRLDREFGRGHDIPERVVAAEVGVLAEAAAVRQVEARHGKLAGFLRELQPGADRIRRRRVCDHLRDRLAASHDVCLAGRGLQQVTAGKRRAGTEQRQRTQTSRKPGRRHGR